MDKNREALALALKLRFGTGPAEPSEAQLDDITAEIEQLANRTEQDWADAVRRHCPGAGRYRYGSIDNSDLNELLAQGNQKTQAAGGSQKPGGSASQAKKA